MKEFNASSSFHFSALFLHVIIILRKRIAIDIRYDKIARYH